MANLLTAFRLLLVIPVAWAMADEDFLPAYLVLLLIFLSILSDYFDGKLARATNTASTRGQLFDHSTDFVFVSSGLAGAAFAGIVTPVLPALIVVAFSQYVLDSYFLFHQKELRMSFLGRWNGVFYFAPLLLISCSRIEINGSSIQLLETLASWVALILTISTIASVIDRGIAPFRKKL